MKRTASKLSIQRHTIRRLSMELTEARGGTVIKDGFIDPVDDRDPTKAPAAGTNPIDEGNETRGDGMMPTM